MSIRCSEDRGITRRYQRDPRIVTVREFISLDSGPDFEVLQGQEGLENEIRSPRIQKLGMALAGFTGYIHPDRVQIFGSSEMHYYLRTLGSGSADGGDPPPEEAQDLLHRDYQRPGSPGGAARVSRASEEIPVLRSTALSSISIARMAGYLEKRLAPRMTIHGVLLEIFGLGVLLLGPSGIGKSECALELVLKGHRLITDDYVELTRRGIDRLSGTGGKVLKHHMELRGLGIINIKELFGISATGVLRISILPCGWSAGNPDAEYDRLGLDQSSIEFLGVSIPLIDMPVAPGRNVATLVEVAARIHLLRQRGYQPYEYEFDDE